MSDVAVRVENLGKMYRIGSKQELYRTLRDTITDSVAAPFKRARNLLRGQAYGAANLNETIWALKDVSFEVKHGEVVGIIGRNGAGKSTLLKILSRITEPTTGYADVFGRVGALLEVGTGFHPELTGRENIYLNGAILGMSRAEIDRKFDEIVAFAEIEKFIDTPVKHYSSGMGLRLGFAVAAHLEPEILVVDEVLAVGDAQFQKKCLGKMSEVAGEGRTVLFVSHNMAAVSELCQKAYRLDSGYVVDKGDVANVIHQYLTERKQHSPSLETSLGRKPGKGGLFRQITLLRDGVPTNTFAVNDRFHLAVLCDLPETPERVCLGIVVKNSLGQKVFSSNTDQYGIHALNNERQVLFEAIISQLPLSPGTYSISLYLGNRQFSVDALEDACLFDVVWNPVGRVLYPPSPNWGPLFINIDWHVQRGNS